jgi:hypothetical protein
MSWVGIGVAVVGGALSYESSRKAARAQVKSSKEAIAEQQAARAAQEARMEPFLAQAEPALQQQAALTGLGGPEAQQEAFQAFAQSPGQQFLREQQERALVRQASAIGGLGGGNIRSALQQQAFQRAQTDIGQQFNRLASISGSAQTAAGQLGQFGAQSAANIGNLQQAGGAARASGILGQSQAIQQALGSGVGIYAQQGGFNQQQPGTTQQQPSTLNQPQQFQA